MTTCWLLGTLAARTDLHDALRARGLDVRLVDGGLPALTRETYDAPGLVLVDSTDPRGWALVHSAGAVAVPLVALAPEDRPTGDRELPEGVLRLGADLEAREIAHHLADVARDAGNLRRHPRVPCVRPLSLPGGVVVATQDVSLYGLRLSGGHRPGGPLPAGDFEARLDLGPGEPAILLRARVVAEHAESTALRVRPGRDVDLVLWIDLLLGALAASPLHRDVDPFGPLFAVD